MIKEIKLNGKPCRFSFGLGFIGDLLEALELDYVAFGKKFDANPFKMIPLTMMHSYNYANEIKITIEQMVEMIEEDGGMQSEGMMEFKDTYILSLTKGVPKQATTENKKKVKA